MLQLLSSIPQISNEVLARPPPGLLIMVDMMAGQIVFNGVMAVLQPGYKDLGVRWGVYARRVKHLEAVLGILFGSMLL
jgi:hypothetical protein